MPGPTGVILQELLVGTERLSAPSEVLALFHVTSRAAGAKFSAMWTREAKEAGLQRTKKDRDRDLQQGAETERDAGGALADSSGPVLRTRCLPPGDNQHL